MAAVDSVFNYYMSTYGSTNASRYDTHKKSELRNIYNTIVKLNKETPLYKIENSENTKKFAIDIKESARNICNVVSSLTDADGKIDSAFKKKVAFSTQEDLVSTRYIGSNVAKDETPNFTLEVQSLATKQKNLGRYIDSNQLNLRPDNYSFDLTVYDTAYEFQFTVNKDDTNARILEKLARLITNANIGLNANVLTDHTQSALQIESLATGLSSTEDAIFVIADDHTSNSKQAIEILGIDQVMQPAQSSHFTLDKKECSSLTNTFTINNAFELSLHGITMDDPITIGFKADTDAIADNIQELVDSYNGILHTAENDSFNLFGRAKLLSQIGNIGKSFQNELESIGLCVEDNGFIQIDKALLAQAVTETEENASYFPVLNKFKNAIDQKATKALLDPMEYVNKVVLVYKNPGKNFVSPYITSIYSGFLFNSYC